MKRLAAILLLSGLALPSLAQSDPWLDDFKKHWRTSREFTLAVAEAMPEPDFAFKPNPEEMSFGELMVHIALSQASRFCQVADQKLVLGQGADAQPPDMKKASVVKYLADSFDLCERALAVLKPEQLNRSFEVKWYGMPNATGREILSAMLVHTAHHRGQAEVYLRVKGIKPPLYRF